ncbi:MAG: PDZ domain-containing protein, partial [Rhodanobacter sp.]
LLPLGSTLQLGVLRDGQARTIGATLSVEKLASIDGAQLDARLAGVRFSELDESRRSQGNYGVAIAAVQAGSRAARAGLTRDDIVIGVNNQRITSLRMLRGLAGVQPRQLVLVVADADGTRYVVVN